MRVLIVIDGLGTGGAERSIAEMLPGYVERGIDVTVACFHRRAEGVQDAVIAHGHDVRFIESPSLWGRVRALRRLATEEQIDLIHTQLFDANIAGRLAAVGLHTAVLTSLVNTEYGAARAGDPNVARYKLEAGRLIDSWTGRLLNDHFHAISHAVKDAATTHLGINADRMTVVERGRDPNRLGVPSVSRKAAARESLGLAQETPVLITAGRQEYQKGQVHLLRAMAELRQRVPGVVLLLAGRDGHASAELRKVYGELSLDRTVQILGHRDDVPELLAAADLFVFPSLYEGIAGSVIEAMALGLPIVASDIPAMREVLEPEENSVLVPPADPQALADAVERLLSDAPLMDRFAARSELRFAEQFTLDRAVGRMAELYERVVDQRVD
jgi:glycosyltransferase involved in cell wall biosynthesis